MRSRLLVALFVAYVATTAVHIGWVIAHEPFVFDAWNVTWTTNGEPITIGRFFEFWWNEYTHSNPRIGQAFTYLAYKVAGFAEVATPLAYLGLVTAVVVLGIGRWPWRRARDLSLWAIAIGFGWFAFPEIGRNMFCRAYSANYVYAAAMIVWFLVPLRLARSYDVSPNAALLYAIAGVVAGMCNEHTGPALVIGLLGYAWWRRRRGERPRLLWAGGLGALAGFLALFFSPGQAERYEGLGTKVSIPMRVIRRGIINNLDIVRDYILYAAPVLLVIVVLVVVARDRERLREPLRLVLIALVAGAVLTLTLFASPRLGTRFYYVSMALVLAGAIAVIDAVERGRVVLVLLAVAASVYAAARTVPLYQRVKRESDARLAQLAAAPPGASIVVDSFEQVPESWWFIGDDFRVLDKRERVAQYLGLTQVGFRESNALVPLGIGGARIVARAWKARCDGDAERAGGKSGPAVCDDTCPVEVPLDLSGLKPFDVAGFQRSIRTTFDALTQSGLYRRIEVVVEVPGAELPRKTVLLARSDNSPPSYSAVIDRPGASTERRVKLGPELAGKPFDLFAVQIGSKSMPLGPDLRYTPWRTGIYWILACDASECWIVAAGRNHAL